MTMKDWMQNKKLRKRIFERNTYLRTVKAFNKEELLILESLSGELKLLSNDSVVLEKEIRYFCGILEYLIYLKEDHYFENFISFLCLFQKKLNFSKEEELSMKELFDMVSLYYNYLNLYERTRKETGTTYLKNSYGEKKDILESSDIKNEIHLLKIEYDSACFKNYDSEKILLENLHFEGEFIDHNNKKWLFKIPKTIKEISIESKEMFNCLGTYSRISEILNHKIFVIFMRAADAEEEPFIDIILNENYQKMWWILKYHKEAEEYYTIIKNYLKTIIPEYEN